MVAIDPMRVFLFGLSLCGSNRPYARVSFLFGLSLCGSDRPYACVLLGLSLCGSNRPYVCMESG